MKRKDMAHLFRKDEVQAESVADFLARYYKPDRYTGRGADYAATLLASYQQALDADGYIFISHHDSVTGQVASFYKKENNA